MELPHRKLAPGKLVIASHNKGKLKEIAELLAPYGIETVSAAAMDVPEPEETGTSFVANAELKARFSADLTGLPALADDSGLCVEALGGEPGIFSARWAEMEDGTRDFAEAMRRVNARVSEKGPESGHDAHFVCALSIAWPDGHVESFEGRVDGTLVWPPRGSNGFGYDAMFQALGMEQTFGEIEPEAKHAMSHRADAFAKLVAAVF
ncbi:RdgB/HAM1 family non-canonical purine NTP pyrophosphatase [Sphingomonas montanisoli]|uniref:dITP/XTP pyrophosphatase n=1 Tax=Sphingomonas montanisoli TaxID=2606412 RepID=A0A5D9CCD4_9SPHN|nr:RdgB/HAM1 family non-canonical purine NTP pyrophosphatase [Sphingomonas montanisoli]TZG29618.1 RdgB/HAM1 family non-canonical purine NTP pyrophosphatase [Sphingomonas montanisoli]